MGRKNKRDSLADTAVAYPSVEDRIMAELDREDMLSDLRDLSGSPLDVDYFWQ